MSSSFCVTISAVTPVFLLTMVCLCSGTSQKPASSQPEKGSCPVGQVRKALPMSDPRTGFLCCKTWNYSCPHNYEYVSCSENGGWDECRRCSHGYILPFITNLTNQKRCYDDKKKCMEGKIPLDGATFMCICDLAKNYHLMNDGVLCDYGRRCTIGEELQEHGTCQSCSPGTYKNTTGIRRCSPWTNCEKFGLVTVETGTNKVDNTCAGSPTLGPRYSRVTNVTKLDNDTDNNRETRQVEEAGAVTVVVMGCIVGTLAVLALVYVINKYRPCSPKTGGDMLTYVELQARQLRADGHVYEQVQSSDEDLEIPASPFSELDPHSYNAFVNGGPASTAKPRSTPDGKEPSPSGNDSDMEEFALTVMLPEATQKDTSDKPIGWVSPQPRTEDDGLRLNIISGENIAPFDDYLRITSHETGTGWGDLPSAMSGGEQVLPDNIHDLSCMTLDSPAMDSPAQSDSASENQTDTDDPDITDVKHV